jgi:hypothetical protein
MGSGGEYGGQGKDSSMTFPNINGFPVHGVSVVPRLNCMELYLHSCTHLHDMFKDRDDFTLHSKLHSSEL